MNFYYKETLPDGTEIQRVDRKRVMILAGIILLLALIFYFILRDFSAPKDNNFNNNVDVFQPTSEPDKNVDDTQATSTGSLIMEPPTAIALSENYKLLQLNFDGSETNIFDLGDNEIFKINSLKSELYLAKDGDKDEIRAVINCQTNKRSYVEVAYIKSGEKDKRIIKDTSFNFNHVLTIPGLTPDSVYKYSVSATDLNNNTVNSEQFVFYTGAANISLVDLLQNAVQKVFGWAIKK
jgi:hypothetical protein